MSKIKLAVRKAYQECRFFGKISPLNFIYALVLDYLISCGKAKKIYSVIVRMEIKRNPLLAYYSARVFFLLGFNHKAITILTELTKRFPNHADLAYLLSDCLWSGNDVDSARDILETTLENSHRLKTWLMLANLTNEDEDYQRLKKLWSQYKEKGKVPPYHYNLDSYISTAAMRSKNYEDAIVLWQSFILKTMKEKCVFPKSSGVKKFSSNSAAKALLDLDETLKSNNIEFFLVSGTLLGCIRDGKLLSHDKDIDVGIWSDLGIENAIQAVKNSGIFYVQNSRSDLALRIKHVNGTAIDIFLHFREEGNYWHGGSKLKWSNTPFELVKHHFLKRIFLIPKNYDLYLSENYGNWKVKKTNFDSAFDTPNATVINRYEMIVHTYKALALSLYEKNSKHSKIHLNTLKALGENNFVSNQEWH